MPRSVLAYLSDIIGACEAIGRFLAGVDYAAYRERELVRAGVERQLIVIGEAVTHFCAASQHSQRASRTLGASSTSATSSLTTMRP